jgi:hypothetical protein
MKKLIFILALFLSKEGYSATTCEGSAFFGGFCVANCPSGNASCSSGWFSCTCGCGTIIRPAFEISYNSEQIERWDWLVETATNSGLEIDFRILVTNIKNAIDNRSFENYDKSTTELKIAILATNDEFKSIIMSKARAEGFNLDELNN